MDLFLERSKETAIAEAQKQYPTIDYHILLALHRYATKHILAGHFVTAVLSNDLREAIGRADSETLIALHPIVYFCHDEIPDICWGSKKKVENWLKQQPKEN